MDIEVTLSDAADGTVLARSVAPPESLPPNFDGTQMLQLGGSKWRVVHAEPADRDEYEVIGTLKLLLRRVEEVAAVPVDDIHYSMSSICDELPPIDGPLDGESALSVKDDLWRDAELVGPGQDAEIAEVFAGIDRVYAESRVGQGFREIYVRTAPVDPLAQVNLTFAELAEAFGATAHFLRPVAIEGLGAVRDGYALSVTPGVHIYGVAVDDRVTVAGIHRTAPADNTVAEALATVLRRHGCELVDWRNRMRIGATATLADWFGSEPQALWR
jgi:hypothetical protein